jgi:protein SCO1/2
MKNFSKAGLLIVTLVIPALIFAYLNFFAKNHYILPYFFPSKDAKGNVIVQNGDTLYRKAASICPELNDFEFEGKLTVVNTLPASCDSQCVAVLAQLNRIAALEKGIPQLGILSIAEKSPYSAGQFREMMGKDFWQIRVQAKIPVCFEDEENKTIAVNSRLVLIDNEGFVRGFYDGSNEVETDRLMAEIKILEYETGISKQ